MKKLLLASLFVSLAVACGGKSTPATTDTTPTGGDPSGGAMGGATYGGSTYGGAGYGGAAYGGPNDAMPH